MSIAFAKRFAVLPCTNLYRQSEPRMVMSNCGYSQQRYFCAPCDMPLANVGQLAMHAEDHPEVAHVIAKWCDRHSTYELAAPVTLPDVARPAELFEGRP